MQKPNFESNVNQKKKTGGHTMPNSRLFQRHRSLGLICNRVPATVRFATRRQENIIITSVGRVFHVYSSNHFRLICVSGLHPDDITCITSDNRFVYTSCGTKIYAWRAGNIVRHHFDGHQHKVHLLHPFGVQHLISIDTSSLLKVWNVQDETEFCEIQFNTNDFKITAICHPPTYLNKILLGSEQGNLQLWNIKTSTMKYNYQRDIFDTKVLVLEPAPAIDVVAVGLAGGDVVLLNLKYDEIVMQFKQDWGPATAISFRTDGQPYMMTGSPNGHIVVWNLEERNIFNQFQAHTQCIASAVCMTNEPLLFTSSADNSIKLWIFDLPDGRARLLRIREGHAAPPISIKYYGSNGAQILSAGEDSSLRAISTISETLNKSFGRASYNRKASKKRNKMEEDPFQMPPIVEFTAESTREKEWDNIAAIHSGLVVATTWSFGKCKMGELRLVPEKYQNKNRTDFNVEATCISLTHCGNFVIIGYSAGDIERFNIQSGIHRQTYGGEKKLAHKSAVRGVHSDCLNQMVISGDSDGCVKFWNFTGNTTLPLSKLTLSSGITMFRAHPENALVCIVLDNFTVNILDYETKAIVRKFDGHTARITDAAFSADSRWLITASMDCTIKIYDIPSAYMIDHFQLETACISLSISPNGDFLSTAHVNKLGIYTWANKSLFSYVSIASIDPFSTPPKIDLPDSTDTSIEPDDAIQIDEKVLANNLDYKSPAQIDGSLITMSTLAASRWQNLLDLDTVKKRNRPKIPLTKPKHASFFLPTVAGLDFQFDLSAHKSNEGDDGDSKELTKFKRFNHFSNLTKFGHCLDASAKSNDFTNCINHITALGPSAIDFEIKSLDPNAGGNDTVMLQFMKMIQFMLQSNRNFELAQSYLGVFLKEHSRYIVSQPTLSDYLKEIELVQNECWKKLENRLLYGIAVASESRLYAN